MPYQNKNMYTVHNSSDDLKYWLCTLLITRVCPCWYNPLHTCAKTKRILSSHYMGQVTEVRLSCYLDFLSVDRKQDNRTSVTHTFHAALWKHVSNRRPWHHSPSIISLAFGTAIKVFSLILMECFSKGYDNSVHWTFAFRKCLIFTIKVTSW